MSFRISKAILIAAIVVLMSGCVRQTVNTRIPAALPNTPVIGGYYNASNLQNRIVREARAKLGAPYRYGGSTPSGFDCSGFTQYVFRRAGISIPRTAARQRDQSYTIRRYGELRPGDLIFFRTGKKSNHVGIFIGNRRFIHASTSNRRVIVDSMDKSYWRQRFVKFGRYG